MGDPPTPLDYGNRAQPSRWARIKDMLLLGAIGAAFGVAFVAFVLWWFLLRNSPLR